MHVSSQQHEMDLPCNFLLQCCCWAELKVIHRAGSLWLCQCP
jgi:hypothetical protein